MFTEAHDGFTEVTKYFRELRLGAVENMKRDCRQEEQDCSW